MKFKPEDFEDALLDEEDVGGVAADIANKLLEEWLNEAPLVHCRQLELMTKPGLKWRALEDHDYYVATHTAKLVYIKEIK